MTKDKNDKNDKNDKKETQRQMAVVSRQSEVRRLARVASRARKSGNVIAQKQADHDLIMYTRAVVQKYRRVNSVMELYNKACHTNLQYDDHSKKGFA